MFTTILIANRGEIACRVATTARRMGIRTVAVYSDADAQALHVRHCDAALHIGGSAAAESYLRGDAIVAAALSSGAQAVHPGYGFLSENADFAQACLDAGLVFIGPPPSAMRAMGLKAQAKALMARAGVPLVPGYHGADQDPALLQSEADRMGYPVLIKASAGGGGKGMRIVERAGDFAAALAGCQREAVSSFGNGAVLIERYVQRPRHIEVQIFGDNHGNYLHLFERDCSVQRRHQKVLEEAPAPGMTEALRAQMGAAAVAAARAVGYVGAGTVEFIVEQSGYDQPESMQFFFMEMNTRLQVEHPVTEALVGEDLVQWQLHLAMGEPLTLTQDDMLQRFESGGHAIEARICAEDPLQQHMPQSGTLLYWQAPDGLRCDAALVSGQTIGSFYDSMLGKLIAHAATREQAAMALADGLERTVCLGVANNTGFLAQVLRSDVFLRGVFNTSVLHTDLKHLPESATSLHLLAIAALVVACVPRHVDVTPSSAWWNWHSSGQMAMQVPLRIGGQLQHWQVHMQQRVWQVSQGDEAFELSDLQLFPAITATTGIGPNGMSKGRLQLVLNRQPMQLVYAWSADELWLQLGGDQCMVVDARLQPTAASPSAMRNQVQAPMHGRVVRMQVAAGDTVKAGQLLVVMEAMKMEHHLHAHMNGIVQAVCAAQGMQVSRGQLLVQLTPYIDDQSSLK